MAQFLTMCYVLNILKVAESLFCKFFSGSASVVQWIKLLIAGITEGAGSSPSSPFLIQLPALASGRTEEDGPSA